MKKFLAFFLAAGFLLTMTACGGNNSTSSATTTKSEGAATTAKTDGSAGTVAGDKIDMSNLSGLKVGFAQCDTASSFRIAETESIEKSAAENNVTLITTDAKGDIAKQASDVEDMIAQGVDYIIIAPQEEDGLQNALKEAMDQGIGVVLIDRSVKGDAGVHFSTAIMSDFVWEAEQAAKKIIETTDGKGNVVILQGSPGATATTDRQSGFMKAIEGTDLKVIADQPAGFLMAEAQSVMENILQAKGDEIDVVYCHNDDMALGALAAIKAAGYKPGEDILVVGIDGAAAAMEAILAGEMLCTVSCNPRFGPIAFETISKLEAKTEVPAKITNEDTVYDKSNADPALGF